MREERNVREEDMPTTFWNVDQTSAPDRAIDYLVNISDHDFAKEYKDIKEGQHILEVGCGVGDEARTLAQMVGSTGRVTGLDFSNVMIAEAINLTKGLALPIGFRQGDIHNLDFEDDTFDGCRADRTFQHLEDPPKAMSELVRVARCGARIVVCEPDWDSVLVDSPNIALTRKIMHARCDMLRNGWMGRKLYALFQDAGLRDVVIKPKIFALTDYAEADQILDFSGALEYGREMGVISETEGAEWLSQLQKADSDGRFFWSATVFIALGIKSH